MRKKLLEKNEFNCKISFKNSLFGKLKFLSGSIKIDEMKL